MERSRESTRTFRVIRVFRGSVYKVPITTEHTENTEQNRTTKHTNHTKSLQFQIRLDPPDPLNPRSKKPLGELNQTKKDAARMRRPNRQKTRSLGQNYYNSPLARSPLTVVIIKTFSPARLTFYLCGRINAAAPRERRQESAEEQDRGNYHECRQTEQCPVHAPKRFRGIFSYKMLFAARCDYLFRHSF
jgi:hypothetical protein